jgi:hypothetical protein
MKILVLCLDNSFGPWEKMYQGGTLKTWCSPTKSQIICRRYMGRKATWPVMNRLINRILVSRFFAQHWGAFQSKKGLNQVNVTESKGVIRVELTELWSNITLKTLAALNYVLENYEFDYLMRVNSTCYFNQQALEEYLRKNLGSTVYAGPIASGKEFVSGWGILLSRDCTKLLVSSFSKEDQTYFDDEAIGKVLKKRDVIPQGLPFIEIFSNKDVDQISEGQFNRTPFFRMKFTQGGNRKDDELMRKIHNRVASLAK